MRALIPSREDDCLATWIVDRRSSPTVDFPFVSFYHSELDRNGMEERTSFRLCPLYAWASRRLDYLCWAVPFPSSTISIKSIRAVDDVKGTLLAKILVEYLVTWPLDRLLLEILWAKKKPIILDYIFWDFPSEGISTSEEAPLFLSKRSATKKEAEEKISSPKKIHFSVFTKDKQGTVEINPRDTNVA